MTHDHIRAVCTEKENPASLTERLITVAGFAFLGMSLLLGSFWA